MSYGVDHHRLALRLLETQLELLQVEGLGKVKAKKIMEVFG